MDKRRFCASFAIIAACLAPLLAGGLLASAASAATQTWDTPVFGGYNWVVPSGVTTATFDLGGASGGAAGGSIGGKGGETVATIAVTPGETLNISVGGAGANAPSSGVPNSTGFGTNGGGESGFYCHPSVSDQSICEGGGGGGASDVRQGGTGLANRVLVAGGGGGGGGTSGTPDQTAGGDGGSGGFVGGRGSDGADTSPTGPGDPSFLGGCGSEGATQAAGGAVVNNDLSCYGNYAVTGDSTAGSATRGGTGGNSRGGADGGGGGGGYFGGGGGSGGAGGNDSGGPTGGGGGGGGGGSSFAAGAATNVSFSDGVNLGDGNVTVTYVSSDATPANTALPTISGTPVAGHNLICNKGSWSGSLPQNYAYHWLRNGVAITGATNATYLVKSVDAGKQLRCRVTATNGGGSAMATSAAKLIKTPPKNTVAPKITGTPKLGKTLSCSLGTWTGSSPMTYTRQWLRNGTTIAAATGSTYVVKAADDGKFLTCKVRAHNNAGTATKTSAAVKVA